jgi:hypothetical protein
MPPDAEPRRVGGYFASPPKAALAIIIHHLTQIFSQVYRTFIIIALTFARGVGRGA